MTQFNSVKLFSMIWQSGFSWAELLQRQHSFFFGKEWQTIRFDQTDYIVKKSNPNVNIKDLGKLTLAQSIFLSICL